MNFSEIINRQRTFFYSGATRSLRFRHEQLEKLADLLETRETDLLTALHADLRKSPHEAYISEIAVVLSEIRHAIKHLSSWMKPERRRSPMLAWPAHSHICPEPYGVTLIIGPWNYALQLLLAPLVGAIAAGNCAVLKASEFAPHTAEVVDDIIRSNFPEDYLTVIRGERETAEALLREKFDKIFFTGGTETGRAVMAAAAHHLTPVTLELGGKCPCIVCDDAPVEITARRILWGKFMNAGQTCVAPDHVWVDSRIAEPLITAMRNVLIEFFGECPQNSPDFGRVINSRHFERLKGYLKEGQSICGGKSDSADLYIAPTILTHVCKNSQIMSEEIFGPILPILEFSDLAEVITQLRDRPKSLAVYLFTRDSALQERVISQTQSGGICINDTILHILGNDLPFGGIGESGMGNYHGRASFDCFSHSRTIMIRSLGAELKLRYPPQRFAVKTLKRILRYIT